MHRSLHKPRKDITGPFCVNADTGGMSVLTGRHLVRPPQTDTKGTPVKLPKASKIIEKPLTKVIVHKSRRRRMHIPEPILEAVNEGGISQSYTDASDSTGTNSSHESSPMVAPKKPRFTKTLEAPNDIAQLLESISTFVFISTL